MSCVVGIGTIRPSLRAISVLPFSRFETYIHVLEHLRQWKYGFCLAREAEDWDKEEEIGVQWRGYRQCFGASHDEHYFRLSGDNTSLQLPLGYKVAALFIEALLERAWKGWGEQEREA